MYSIIIKGTTNGSWWVEAKSNGDAVAQFVTMVGETIASTSPFEGVMTLNMVTPDGSVHTMRSVTFD